MISYLKRNSMNYLYDILFLYHHRRAILIINRNMVFILERGVKR